MSGYDVEREVIEVRFNTEWAATTKVLWANVDDSSIPPKNAAWVSLDIITGESNNIGVGSNAKLHRASGLIEIGIFTPKGTGMALADTYADTIAAIFRNWEHAASGIVCYSPYRTNLGDSGEYNQVNVTVPYRRDAIF